MLLMSDHHDMSFPFSVSPIPQVDGAEDDSDDESMGWIDVVDSRKFITT